MRARSVTLHYVKGKDSIKLNFIMCRASKKKNLFVFADNSLWKASSHMTSTAHLIFKPFAQYGPRLPLYRKILHEHAVQGNMPNCWTAPVWIFWGNSSLHDYPYFIITRWRLWVNDQVFLSMISRFKYFSPSF